MNYPLNAIIVIGVLAVIFGFEIFIVMRAERKNERNF